MTKEQEVALLGAPVEVSLEELLLGSERHGDMRLSKIGKGWYAIIKMNTNTTGSSFEVASNFGHHTPVSAAAECIYRVNAALQTLKNGTS